MNNIDFETDQAKVITKTENIRSLADQVERLENLNQEIEKKENKAHLQQKWNTMVKEIHQDYDERMIDKDES